MFKFQSEINLLRKFCGSEQEECCLKSVSWTTGNYSEFYLLLIYVISFTNVWSLGHSKELFGILVRARNIFYYRKDSCASSAVTLIKLV